jgi:hypothetical protein
MANESSRSFRRSYGSDRVRLQDDINREIQKEQEDRLGAGELYEIAKDREQLAPSLDRQIDRESGLYSKPESGGYLSEEELANRLGTGYTQGEYDLVARASNEDEFDSLMEGVQRDRQQARTMAKEGWRGIGYSTLAGMLDPALLPLYVATGGLGAVGRAGLAARTAASAAVGAAEGAAVETVVGQGSTQRGWREVALAGVGGGIISGAIPLGVAGFKKMRRTGNPDNADTGRPNPPESVNDRAIQESAMDADAALSRAAKRHSEDMALANMQSKLSIETVRTLEPRKKLIDELRPVAERRLSRGDRKPLISQEASTLSVISDLDKSLKRAKDTMPTGGTKASRAKSARNRKENIQRLESRVSAERKKLADVKRRLHSDEQGRNAWEDISRLSQGQRPRNYEQRFQELQAEGKSPFQNQEYKNVRDLAAKAEARRKSIAEQERAEAASAVAERARVDPEGEVRTNTGDAGAARAPGAEDEIEPYASSDSVQTSDKLFEMQQRGESLGDTDFIRKAAGLGSRRAASGYTNLTRSDSNVTRGLAHTLLNDPQQASRGHISASQRLASYERRILNAEGGQEDLARQAWAKERGIRGIAIDLWDGESARMFDDSVVLEMKGIDQGSPAIKDAAKARADILEESLKVLKASGAKEFKNVTSDRSYWSTTFSSHKFSSAVNKHSPESVIDTLTGAYMNGKFKMGEVSARMVAKNTYAREMGKRLSTVDRQSYGASKKDLEFLQQEMTDLGVPIREIEEYIDSISAKADSDSASARSKFSLGADHTYELNGLRMVDLLDTSKGVTNRYAADAAATAALAKSGFKSRTELEDFISSAQKAAFNDIKDLGLPESKAAKMRSDVEADYEVLNRITKLMYRESIDTDGLGTQLSRASRKVTNLTALQWNGITSAPEISNMMVNLGTSMFRNLRIGSFMSFGRVRNNPELQEFGNIMGAYGQLEASIRDRNYALESMDEANQSKTEEIFNKFAGAASEKSQLLSAFRSLQHGLEDTALMGMQDRLVRMADGRTKTRQHDMDNLERGGLRRDQIDELMENIRNNPEHTTVNGKSMQVFSGKHLSPELFDDVSTALTGMMSRNMQQNFIGDTPMFMEKEIGKILTQFRSWSILSVEKQMGAGLRGSTSAFFLSSALGMGLAVPAYSSRAWLRSKIADDPEEKWNDYMDDSTRAIGMINMSPQLGLLSLGSEVAIGSGLLKLPDSAMASRSGTRDITPSNIIPALGVGVDAGTGLRDLLAASTHGEGEDGGEAAKDLLGMAPLINSAAVGAAWAIAKPD